MTQQILNVGSSANDGTGDTLRAAMVKTNENFTELYNSPLLASGITVRGNEIQATRTTIAIRALPTPIAVEFKVIALAGDVPKS